MDGSVDLSDTRAHFDGCGMENPWNYVSHIHANHVIDAINELRKNNELCDVVLVVDGHLIHAHRLILSACSPYFHGLFEGPSHSGQPQSIEVPLSGIDPDAAENAIDYCYTSHLVINDENVWSLLPAASLLQLEEVQNVCCDFLKGRLNASNCVKMKLMAVSCHCNTLMELCDEFIRKDFNKVMAGEEFLGLSAERLSGFLAQCQSWCGEHQLSRALASWLEQDRENRTRDLTLIIRKFPWAQKFVPVTQGTDRPDTGSAGPKEKQQECSLCGLPPASPRLLNSQMTDRHGNVQKSPKRAPACQSNCPKPDSLTEEDIDLICEICSKHYHSDIEMTNHCLGHIDGFSPAPVPAPDTGGGGASGVGVANQVDMVTEDDLPNVSDLGNLSGMTSESTELTNGIQDDSLDSISEFANCTSADGFLRNYRGEKHYQCKICNVKTGKEREMYNHCNSVHGNLEPPLNCGFCHKHFKDKPKLLSHLVNHSTVVYFCCPLCEKQSRTKANLQIHMRIHTGERPFVCSYCSKGFRNYCVLKVHVRSHTGEKPFSCKICGQSFTKNIHLKRHVSTHSGEKPFRCDLCGRDFGRNDHLQRHIKTIHTQEKPHQCPLCGKEFFRRYELDRHLKHHMKKNENAPKVRRNKDRTSRKAQKFSRLSDVERLAMDVPEELKHGQNAREHANKTEQEPRREIPSGSGLTYIPNSTGIIFQNNAKPIAPYFPGISVPSLVTPNTADTCNYAVVPPMINQTTNYDKQSQFPQRFDSNSENLNLIGKSPENCRFVSVFPRAKLPLVSDENFNVTTNALMLSGDVLQEPGILPYSCT